MPRSRVCSTWHEVDVKVRVDILLVELLFHFFEPGWWWYGVDVVEVSMPFLVLAPSVFLVLLKFSVHIRVL